MNCRRAAIVLIVVLSGTGMVRAQLPTAEQVLTQAGIKAGLAVVLGTTDGRLEAGLHNGGRILVHGLSTDWSAVSTAREHLFGRGVYGLSSVDYASSLTTLPYYECFINLLVADLDALGASAPPESEIMRVLAYNGIAYVKQRGTWTKKVREMPDNVGEFTQYRHDAARSNTASDELAGPPNALRYVGRPTSHQGYHGCRVGKGIVLHMSNKGRANKYPDPPDRQIAYPDRVFAKDAFSGIYLWHKDVNLGHKVPEIRTIGDTWALLLVKENGGAVGLEALDLETGEQKWRQSYDDLTDLDVKTVNSFEKRYCVSVADGTVYHNVIRKLFARRELDGAEIWSKELCAGNTYICEFMVAESLVVALVNTYDPSNMKAEGTFVSMIALSAADGTERWRIDGADLVEGTVPGYTPSGNEMLVHVDGYSNGKLPLIVLTGAEGDVIVLLHELATGKRIWAVRDTLNVGGHMSIGKWESYIHGERLFVAQLTRARGYDLSDGTPIDEQSWGAYSDGTYNGIRWSNCNTGIATRKFLMLHKLFQPWDSIMTHTHGGGGGLDKWPTTYLNRLVSHACVGFSTPAYAAIYNDEGTCNCASFLPASTCLFARTPTTPVPDATRLDTQYNGHLTAAGPPEQTEAHAGAVSLDWKLPPNRMAMCYSGPSDNDNGRPRASGSMEVWGYSTTVTDPVIVGDVEITAYVHEHRLTARRGTDDLWTFVAGGRIGSRGGLQGDDRKVYFGCHDGYVYAVNGADGTLAWRFLAAPADFRMSAFGQVESSWPVFSVVLHEGTLYCSAGRHQDLEGGIHFYALDPASGAARWHVRHESGLVMEDNKDKAENGVSHCGRTSSINGLLVVQDGVLVLNPIASFFTFPLDKPESWVRNESTMVPPLIPEDNTVGTRPRRYRGGTPIAVVRRGIRIEMVGRNRIAVSAGPDARYHVSVHGVQGKRTASFDGAGSSTFTLGRTVPGAGCYLVRVGNAERTLATRRFVVAR